MSNNDADTATKSHDNADCAAKSTIAHNGDADTATIPSGVVDCAARPVNTDSSNTVAAKSCDDADCFDSDAGNDFNIIFKQRVQDHKCFRVLALQLLGIDNTYRNPGKLLP